MAKKDKNGKWIRSSGKAVAVSDVRPIDRERDRTVERIMNRIERLQQQVEQEKMAILEEIGEYKEICEATFEASFSETGGIVLTNYSGDKQIELKVNKQIYHDEKLQLAENLMRDALNEMIESIRDELNGQKAKKALKSLEGIRSALDDAFTLDESGRVARHRIISLKKKNIDHQKWKKALKLIDQSEYVRGTRQYLYPRKRSDLKDKLESMNLNFTTI